MQFDRQITISTAGSRKAAKWLPQALFWSEFVERLKQPVRHPETLNEYLSYTKGKQDDLKDVGGFVGGSLRDNRRKASYVLGRDLLTLDLDNIPAGGTESVLQSISALGCGAAVYSTRKHHAAAPRLRVVLLPDRVLTADEYEPFGRKLAEFIGLQYCDPSTFEASRLMYWPSCCADSQYIYQVFDSPPVSVDMVLAQYQDWQDISAWPEVPGESKQRASFVDRQKDPTSKSGIVGAFCKIYNIEQAIAEFLPEVYEPSSLTDRYTFLEGSTTNGAVVYDNGLFLYSHHATDPAGGRLCNAFDLVRLHLFGGQDDEVKPDTPTNKLPSFAAMCQLAVADGDAAALLNKERYEQAITAFSQVTQQTDGSWISLLTVSATTGLPVKTIDNLMIILNNDPALKGKLAIDTFATRSVVLGALPWDDRSEKREWTDNDDAGLKWYIEKVYHITGRERIVDAMSLTAQQNKIDPVQDYLTGLIWDGRKRLDTLYIDYLGADDSAFTRAACRKSLVAAVARAMQPGIKFDVMTILAGAQGIGKSTLLRYLGKDWFSDSLTSFDGKDAAEMLQGTWINELGELSGMSRTEVNAVKQFLSKSEDIYRKPYGHRTESFPRHCVFFGTTNDAEFLRDNTGGRRFWPIDVGRRTPTKSVWDDLPGEVDQIWAEAMAAWQIGEPLRLLGAAEKEALQQQESHRESHVWEGLITEFLERTIPKDWQKWPLGRRLMYWQDALVGGELETVERERVCALEIWCECLGEQRSRMKQADTRLINSVLSKIPGWERGKTPDRFGVDYGGQRGFYKASTVYNL